MQLKARSSWQNAVSATTRAKERKHVPLYDCFRDIIFIDIRLLVSFVGLSMGLIDCVSIMKNASGAILFVCFCVIFASRLLLLVVQLSWFYCVITDSLLKCDGLREQHCLKSVARILCVCVAN